MASRWLLALLQKIRLPSPPPRFAAPSRNFQIATSTSTSTSTSNSGSASDGSFSSSWKHRWGSTLGAVLVGQAVFLGLSNNYVLAQDDSLGQPATESEQAKANVTGLRRIEDGSVISNEHTIKWRIFTDNGRDFFLKGKLDEAEKFFQSALHEAKEGFGLRDPHVASACNNLAELYRIRKEYEKAEPLYLEAVKILEESFGADDIRVGAALHNLGQYYLAQRKFDQARTCYERALKIEGRVLGYGHPDYASTMYYLGKVLSLGRKHKDAEALIKESIRILEEAGLGESPVCIQRMRHLSMNFLRSNRLAEAENLQRKILHNLELSKGWDSLDTAGAAEALALTLQSLGNLKESEELLERCLAARKKILSEYHSEVARNLLLLARLALLNSNHLKKMNRDQARDELDKAKQLLNNSIRITEGILNTSKKDQKSLPSAFTSDRDQIAAILTLVQSLDAFGLLEVTRHEILVPGLVLLLRLPLEPMKHGYFKIDAISVSDTCRLYIWSDTPPVHVQYTTLRIQFKNNFEKEPFEYQEAEQALRKCVSLFKEPHTRSMLSGVLGREYLSCLTRLSNIVRDNAVKSQRMKVQDLLDDVQLIQAELGPKNNRK